jgi:hypothetical protein
MPKLTIIARVADGLPLAASMEDDKLHRDLDVFKNQAKKIFKQLGSSSPARLSIESGSEVFQCAPALPARAVAPRTARDAPHARVRARDCMFCRRPLIASRVRGRRPTLD